MAARQQKGSTSGSNFVMKQQRSFSTPATLHGEGDQQGSSTLAEQSSSEASPWQQIAVGMVLGLDSGDLGTSATVHRRRQQTPGGAPTARQWHNSSSTSRLSKARQWKFEWLCCSEAVMNS